MSHVAGMELFFFLSHFFFLSLQLDLADSLAQSGAEDSFSANLDFLGIDSSGLDFFAIEPWVYTFKKML